MRPRITVLISSLIVAFYFLPSGICAWEDNLEIGVSVTTVAKFTKGMPGFKNAFIVPSDTIEMITPAAVSIIQDSLESIDSGTVTDSGIKVPSAALTGDEENVQSEDDTDIPADASTGDQINIQPAADTETPATGSDTPSADSDTENLPESGNEPTDQQ